MLATASDWFPTINLIQKLPYLEYFDWGYDWYFDWACGICMHFYAVGMHIQDEYRVF